jgi:hypothetical protein
MSDLVNQKSITDTRIPTIISMISIAVYFLVHIRLEFLGLSNQYKDILIPLLFSVSFGIMLYSIVMLLERYDLIKF